jgi:hypothetical protein
MPGWFPCVGTGPVWIRNPDWPFHRGEPMAFVGQVDVPARSLYHDEASFLLFLDPETGTTRVIAQVA